MNRIYINNPLPRVVALVVILFSAGIVWGYSGPTLAELARRVTALEAWQETQVTQYRDYDTEQSLAAYVNLKKRVAELEREVNELDRAVKSLGAKD